MDRWDTTDGGSGSVFPTLTLLLVLTVDVAAILVILMIGIVVYLSKRKKKPDEGEDNSPPSEVKNVTLEKKER